MNIFQFQWGQLIAWILFAFFIIGGIASPIFSGRHLAYEFAVAWLIYACCSGYGGKKSTNFVLDLIYCRSTILIAIIYRPSQYNVVLEVLDTAISPDIYCLPCASHNHLLHVEL